MSLNQNEFDKLIAEIDHRIEQGKRRARWRALILIPVIILMLIGLALQVRAIFAAEPRWHYSDRLYKGDNRTPYSLDISQREMARLALQAGYAGPDGNGPGYRDTVIGLDGERSQAGRVLHVIAPPADTLWKALLMPDKWLPGECSYVAVVRGGAAPDSILVVLTNGTQFMERIERKRK